MSRTLATLLRLRRLEVEAARRSLADSLAAEARAEQALMGAQAALRREAQTLDRAALIPLRHFALWLPHGTAAKAAAELALRGATDASAAARAALAQRQGAGRAAEILSEAVQREADLQARREEEHRLGDMFRGWK